MKLRPCIVWLTVVLIVPAALVVSSEREERSYAVVVAKTTREDPSWARVVDALKTRHAAEAIDYDATVEGALSALRRSQPRYTCFVARPEDVTKELVATVHALTGKLDEDPYTDTIWGILTGFDADNALRIAQYSRPLVVRKVSAGTEVELRVCEEGVWFCELNAGKIVRKEKGQEPQEEKGPQDSTKAIVDSLNDYKADLFVTSGHATERDWQIGFRYRNGQFRSKAGELFGVDTEGHRLPVRSPNPKVYLPVGNCLMGHIDGPDSMALAFLNSAGVHQMIGYTVPTWYGYAGWGCLDYFVEQPGRYTLAEAFFANHQALLHRLETPEPALNANDRRGLTFDRDVLALYGDPAWEARMAPGPLAWDQKLTREGDTFTFTIEPKLGERSFDPVNRNGSQRGGRPIVEILPHRIGKAELIEGSELQPLIADDFILVPNPGKCDPAKTYRVVFRAPAR